MRKLDSKGSRRCPKPHSYKVLESKFDQIQAPEALPLNTLKYSLSKPVEFNNCRPFNKHLGCNKLDGIGVNGFSHHLSNKDDKIHDLVPFVRNAIQEEDVGRTSNIGTSTKSGNEDDSFKE